MRVILSILLGGVIVFGTLFLNSNVSLKTRDASIQPIQDLNNSIDINKLRERGINDAEDNKIQTLVQNLYLSDERARSNAKMKIIELAKTNDLNRKKIIDLILSSLNIPNAQYGMITTKNYDGWILATMILGEIKASEALPDLIQCLSCNNGVGGLSLDQYPIARTVSMIGKESIPYLEGILHNLDQDNTTHLCAILALDSIGGEESQRVLENALFTERKESFRIIIKKSLEKYNNNPLDPKSYRESAVKL